MSKPRPNRRSSTSKTHACARNATVATTRSHRRPSSLDPAAARQYVARTRLSSALEAQTRARRFQRCRHARCNGDGHPTSAGSCAATAARSAAKHRATSKCSTSCGLHPRGRSRRLAACPHRDGSAHRPVPSTDIATQPRRPKHVTRNAGSDHRTRRDACVSHRPTGPRPGLDRRRPLSSRHGPTQEMASTQTRELRAVVTR